MTEPSGTAHSDGGAAPDRRGRGQHGGGQRGRGQRHQTARLRTARPSGTAGPSDELAGRHAAPDAGGADPAPLVMPPRSAPAEENITDDPAGLATGAVGSTTPGVPGAPAATSPPATSGVPAAGGPGIPAAALSEQQWPAIQAMFVDDPKGSVQRAAAAADEVVKAFVASIEREQAALNTAWENDASTEDLRTALQQYRAFCGRLEGLA